MIIGWLGYGKKNVKDINEKSNCVAFCKMYVYYIEPWIKVTSTKFETFGKRLYNRCDTNIIVYICLKRINLHMLTFREDENKVEF